MRVCLLTILLLAACSSEADCHKKPIIVGVLDTGFGYKDKGHTANLCKFGHKDFTTDRQFSNDYETKDPVPLDLNSHGTHIVGTIDSYAKDADVSYCIVIIKYYSDRQTGEENMKSSSDAISYAARIGVDFVNFSGGGRGIDKDEERAVKSILSSGGKFVAAAGNDGRRINFKDPFYPAMYDKRIVVVGNVTVDGIRVGSSNYGEWVNRWEVGENVTVYGITMSGTSMSTAIATGKLISNSTNKCEVGL